MAFQFFIFNYTLGRHCYKISQFMLSDNSTATCKTNNPMCTENAKVESLMSQELKWSWEAMKKFALYTFHPSCFSINF